MKKIILLAISALFVFCTLSCKEDKGKIIGKDNPINITPVVCTISAEGGAFLTFPAEQSFMISGSHTIGLSHEDVDYVSYEANEDGSFLESDFFTVRRTVDNRLDFSVEPNATGKERSLRVDVWSGNRFEWVDLIQAAN